MHTLKIDSEEKLPEFEGLVVSDAEETAGVYVFKNTKNADVSSQAYFAVAPESGEYCITSTELSGAVTVNSKEYAVNEIGAATVSLNKGINEIVMKSDTPVEFKITKESE